MVQVEGPPLWSRRIAWGLLASLSLSRRVQEFTKETLIASYVVTVHTLSGKFQCAPNGPPMPLAKNAAAIQTPKQKKRSLPGFASEEMFKARQE